MALDQLSHFLINKKKHKRKKMNFAEACEKGEFYTVLRNVDLKNLELDEGMQKLLKMVTKKQTLALLILTGR